MNQGLSETMKTSLLEKLDLGAPDSSQRLSDLLEEDPDIKRERESLETKINRLEKVLSELRSFGV